MKLISWIARIAAALILLQTLFFKFTAAPESVYIFTAIGMEPWGRLASGVAELIASLLLLVPRTAWLGAAMALATMAGAIFFHLTILGIEVMEDGGLLFLLALIVVLCSMATLVIHRNDIPRIKNRVN